MFNGTIWGRLFHLKVVYDCLGEEEILAAQEKAYELFRSAESARNESEYEVKQYCLDKNRNEIAESEIDNIFKYVIPKYIYVVRDGRVAIMCNYKFDPEHGIAVIFMDGRLEMIGMQDLVL